MKGSSRHAEFAAALFVLGLLLFNYPLLSAGERAVMVWGIPALMLYLFVAWLAIIIAIAWGERRTTGRGRPSGERDSGESG